MKRISLAVLIVLMSAVAAYAQVEEPTEVVNDSYHFSFTVEEGTLVTYEEGGIGFDAVHNPQGGGKGTQPDYGMRVYAGVHYYFTTDMAVAAKLDPPEETFLSTTDVVNNTRFSELMKAAMSVYDRKPAGDAVVQVEEGASIKVPYFTWSRTVGVKTAYAMMYSVVHGDHFITVQVEGSRPFSNRQVEWFTTKLALQKIPAETVE